MTRSENRCDSEPFRQRTRARHALSIPIAWLALGLTGCRTGAPAPFPTATTLPREPRHPDGVAIDRPTDLPGVDDTSAEYITSLRTPLGDDVALSVVARFFAAVAHEDNDALAALLTRDATVAALSSASAPSLGSAALSWANRFRKLDYTRVATADVYGPATIEIGRRHEHPGIDPTRGVASGVDDELRLRVPILTATKGPERLFGEEVLFVLRRDGDTYRIARLAERFNLP